MRRSFIPMAAPVLGARELECVTDAVKSGWISSAGPYVKAFEEAFSHACGASEGVAVTSGTTALHLALATLNVGPGDEVILPPVTHIACVNAVTLSGATPVLADCSEGTWGLDPDAVARSVTGRTRAIMPVHLYGQPVDVDPILELAAQRGIAVVEDAAEAHGARYKGRPIGSLGDIGCFSFYANKIITTGEGGMLLFRDTALAERARKLRDQAYEPERRFVHRELGFNYRMTSLQAAIGLAQTERLAEFVGIHTRHAQRYGERLAGIRGLRLPPANSWSSNVHWMYSVVLEDSFPLRRDGLMARLLEQGCESRSFFPPIHQQPLYEAAFRGERYPVAEMLSAQGVNLPSGNELTDEEIDAVTAMIRTASDGDRNHGCPD